MITAFVSDIHSNIEALKAVMADIDGRKADRVFCLGDTVNYGPNPAECLRVVRRLDLALMGNHEEGVLNEPIGFNPVAAEAAKWTRSVLEPGFLSHGGQWANWHFMQRLLLRYEEGEMLCVHASPRAPTSEYLLPVDAERILGEASEKMVENFALVKHVCFVGHTHLPGVFQESGGFYSSEDVDNEFRVPQGEKVIVNVGSVGQPRDHNPKACYVTFDGETVRYHRVRYDADKTCAKVLAMAGLPDRCGTRLVRGE